MVVIVDRKMPDEMIKSIEKFFNIKTVISPSIPSLSGAVSTHPDMGIHFLKNDIAVCAPEVYEYYLGFLGQNINNLICGKMSLNSTYPNDIAYNVLRVKSYIFANLKYTDKNILEYYQKNRYNVINTKQGYAKCSAAVFGDVVLTEDAGLFKLLSNIKDIKAYLIEKGNVRLDGYDYGFIGGATGFINNTAIFCGSIKDQNIKDILLKNNISYFEAEGDGLYDYGSVIDGGD